MSINQTTAQHILLYQRLTKVIAKLTDGVEAELQRLMDDLDNRARQSTEKLDELTPKIGRLNEGLQRIERYLSRDLDVVMKKTSEAMRANHEHAENLEQVLNILLANVIQGQSQLAFAHEQSLQHATERIQTDMEAFVAVVSTAIASSTSLQQQLVGYPTHSPAQQRLTFTATIFSLHRTSCSSTRCSRARNGPTLCDSRSPFDQV